MGGVSAPRQSHLHAIGLCVALVEIFLGSVAGNLGTLLHTAIFPPNAWINFLASFGSVVLTFLAGAEIKPESFRRQLVPSLVIGWVLARWGGFHLTALLRGFQIRRPLSGYPPGRGQFGGVVVTGLGDFIFLTALSSLHYGKER